jgi:hypothetical protein
MNIIIGILSVFILWYIFSSFFAINGYISYRKNSIDDEIYIGVLNGRKKIMIQTIIKTLILIIVTLGLILIKIL